MRSDTRSTLPKPQNRCLGYARVSTYGQTLDAQLEQLRKRGLHQDLPREGDGRAGNDRRELLKLLKASPPVTW